MYTFITVYIFKEVCLWFCVRVESVHLFSFSNLSVPLLMTVFHLCVNGFLKSFSLSFLFFSVMLMFSCVVVGVTMSHTFKYRPTRTQECLWGGRNIFSRPNWLVLEMLSTLTNTSSIKMGNVFKILFGTKIKCILLYAFRLSKKEKQKRDENLC